LTGLAQDGIGNNLDNKIFGNDLPNNLSGADGNDQIDGGLGNDVLSGGIGSDDITGGEGADTLIGGAGRDRFHFDSIFETGVSISTMDVILDFDPQAAGGGGGFRIGVDLSKIDADVFLPDDQAFTFIGNQAFSAVGQVRFDQVGSDFVIWLNIDSDASPEAGIYVRTDQTTPGFFSLPDAGWFAL
jgi:serralysin